LPYSLSNLWYKTPEGDDGSGIAVVGFSAPTAKMTYKSRLNDDCGGYFYEDGQGKVDAEFYQNYTPTITMEVSADKILKIPYLLSPAFDYKSSWESRSCGIGGPSPDIEKGDDPESKEVFELFFEGPFLSQQSEANHYKGKVTTPSSDTQGTLTVTWDIDTK
jgi:hypothetical protein